MPPLVKRWRFTVDDFHRMARVGILAEDARVELVDGEIVQMAPIGDHHAYCVNSLTELFRAPATGRFVLSVQNAVRLSPHSELHPDLALLRPPLEKYARGLPSPNDVILLIEVSDTTLAYDRRVKLPRYAAAAIPDAWLVNIPRRTIEVHREPRDGRYQQVTIFRKGEGIAPLALPDITVAVAAVLP